MQTMSFSCSKSSRGFSFAQNEIQIHCCLRGSALSVPCLSLRSHLLPLSLQLSPHWIHCISQDRLCHSAVTTPSLRGLKLEFISCSHSCLSGISRGCCSHTACFRALGVSHYLEHFNYCARNRKVL